MSTPQPDPLALELREELPSLFDAAWEDLSKVQPRTTAWLRQTVRDEIDAHAEGWLSATSREIARIREQRRRVEALPPLPTVRSSYSPSDASPATTDVSRGLTGTAAVAFITGVWQLWPSGNWFWALVISVVVAFVIGVVIYFVDDLRPLSDPVLPIPLAVSVAGTVGYALLWWKGGVPDDFWQWVLWIVLGILAVAADVGTWLLFYDEDELADLVIVWLYALLAVGAVLGASWLGLGIAAVVSIGAIPLLRYVWWSRQRERPPADPAPVEPPPTEEEVRIDQETRAAAEAAMADWRTAAMESLVKPHILRRIGESLAPPFNQPLAIPIAPGLGQLRAGDFLISTDHFAGITNSVRLMTGGALGVAGPRGAGKSTLMEAYQIGALSAEPLEQIVVLESVPVRYDAREFALHLYARLCEEVSAFTERRSYPRTPPWQTVPWTGWRRVLQVGVGVAGVALDPLVWVQAVNALDKQDMPAWLPPAGYPVLVLLAGVTAAALAIYKRRPQPPPPRPVILPDMVEDLDDLRAFAAQKLRRIRFQQHFTQGWSGKLAIPGGPELSRTDTTQWAEQAMTYPDVIHDFRKFLEIAVRVVGSDPETATPPIAILIDELDKISTPGKASEFINEIKALFSPAVEGCLFVVAVSEDALASFQRRGLPVRDEFDSAFDTIVRINYLSRADSFSILRSRVLGLGTEHCSLIYCLAGGLPRDLIRVTRSIVHRQGLDLAQLSTAVIAEDVGDKAEALRTVIVHHTQPEPYASDLIHRVDHVADTSADALAAAIRTLLTAPPPPSTSPAFNSLRTETLGHLYFSLTLLEVFAGALTEDQLKAGTASGPAAFDNLARARQLFAVNARASWLTITAFRTAWGLPAIAQPTSGQEPAQ